MSGPKPMGGAVSIVAAALVLSGMLCGAGPSQAKPDAPSRARSHESPVVITHDGPVLGVVLRTYRKFLGIPFAAPPIGALRWKPPQPHPPWTAAWDGTHFRDACAQINFGFAGPPNSEDCLYLNIYTPNPPPAHLPVMVWIHGGSFLVGSGRDSDGSVLAAKGGVIVVTINYRLGPLGFLALKALDSENADHVSGNYGLLDQQAALRWVRQNIAAFGGDPGNVTIFGESAGGISVCLQMVSPKAAGLFQRAIDQSGPCQNTFKMAEGEMLGDKLAAKLGCDHTADVAACLRSKPVKVVLMALPANPIGGGVLWFPLIDGAVIPTTAAEALRAGKFSRVPVINGSNHDEGTLFVALGFARAGKPMTAAQYPVMIKSQFKKNAQRVLDEYPLNQYSSPASAYSAVFTDALFSCPIRKTTRLLSAFVPTYAYEFNDTKAPNAPFLDHLVLGAYHSSDVQYIFQSRYPAGTKSGDLPFSAKQLDLSNQMIRYWTTFAVTGQPGGTTPRWSRYHSDNGRVLSFAPQATAYETGFAKDHRCEFWDSLSSQ